jgi:glycosyltransferase involved in cell wall biosynthesis
VARQTIAVLSEIDPSGGGSHQWALNILYALDDYRISRRDLDIVIVHYRNYAQGHPLASLFPDFKFAQIGRLGGMAARVLRRLAVWLPLALPLLRPLAPVSRIAARCGANVVLFPVTVLDSALCSQANIFCMADISHIYYPHFPEVSEGNQLRIRDILFRYGLANADQVMVESRELGREIGKHYGVDQKKIHVIYQVLPRLFQLTEDSGSAQLPPKPYIFYPAQLWAHKNHQGLLTAFASLAREFPSLHLVLSGSRKTGDEAIFNRISELGLIGRVSYLGYVQDEEMPKLYRNAAALVMPTYFGPTNIPTLEAFAFGCPAVISDLPGVQEQVADAALKFNPDEPADMAEKIRQVLTDPALSARLVAAGRKRLEDLSYENFRGAMFELFNAALRS